MTDRAKPGNAPMTGFVRVTFDLTPEALNKACEALPEVLLALSDAATVFDFLSSGQASGFLSGDEPEVSALLRLVGRAVRDIRQTEGEALDILEATLCHVRGDMARGELADMKGVAA